MQDEMRITVIAAGFGEPKSVIPMENPLIDEVPVQPVIPKQTVKPSMSSMKSSLSSSSLSSDEDDLDAIFKILDNKK
jgi:hypothetical protein